MKPNETKGFITKDYVKPTATNATFLIGNSYHPRYIIKGILYSEARRLLRLNEKEEGFQNSLKRLTKKCERSGFNKNIIEEAINNINKWNFKERKEFKENPNENEKKEKERTVWATHFKSILNLNKKEQKLMENACITYARPPTLGNLLTKYKGIFNKNSSNTGTSRPCNKCKLCGNHGKGKSMVIERNYIKGNNGKKLC